MSDKEMRKAERAEKVLNDPLVKEALAGIEETIFYNFKTSKYKASEEREELYKMMQVCDKFREQFAKWIRDGQVSRARLNEKLRKVV